MLKEKVNVDCKVVSIGSTPTCSHLPEQMGRITEIHPGIFFFFLCGERWQLIILQEIMYFTIGCKQSSNRAKKAISRALYLQEV
jgi:hypothetical protein